MIKNKKFIIFLCTILSAIIMVNFLSVVSAATFVNMITPSNATGIQNISGSYTLEAWINESAADVYIGNVTWYYQAWGTSTWTTINTTENTTNQSVFTATWDTSALDGKNYTINATALNYDPAAFASGVNSTNITGNVTIDNIAPSIKVYSGAALTVYANGTSIKTTATYANNLTLNISVTDAIFQINHSDIFCFININGKYNHSVLYTDNRWCNTSDINITGLGDGNKTLYIYVNDSINNMRLNTTLVVQIDTTNPGSTATCSPTTVTTGDPFPCSCSGSDTTSGVATSTGASTSPNGISTPSSTGTFTYTCSVADNGGLTSSATKKYSVTQTPGSGPGGGSTGSTTTFWTKGTVSVSTAQFTEGYTNQVSAKQRLKVSINNENHYVGVKSMTSSTVTIEVSSTPQEATLSIGDERKFDIDDDDNYDILVTLNSITDNKADITIQELDEPVTEETITEEEEKEEAALGEEEEPEAPLLPWWAWVIIVVIVLVIIEEVYRKKKK